MERLENVMKDVKGMARKLHEAINDANTAINDIYLDVETRGEMTPGNEDTFNVVLNNLFALDVELASFIETEI